ncbi:MAG: hypothetical protein ACOCXZ_02160 [Chloroflexota bacterium]
MARKGLWLLVMLLTLLPLTVDAIGGGDRLLVWLADGAGPGALTNPNARGALVLMNGDGEVERTIAELNAAALNVQRCGTTPDSPNGSTVAIYAGSNERGSLYLMTGTDDPAVLTGIPWRTCLGPDTLQWAEDSGSLALINYDLTGTLSAGILGIYPTSAPDNPSFTRADVAAFFYDGTRLALVEAGGDFVSVHSGTPAELTELTRLFSGRAGCPHRGAALTYTGPEALAVALGENCGSGNRWSVNIVDIPQRVTNRLLEEPTGPNGRGAANFFAQAGVLALWTNDVGDTLVLTYPNGVLGNFSAEVVRIDLRRAQDYALLFDNAVMPRQPISTPSSAPVTTQDGRWLAIVEQNANRVSALHLIDLETGTLARTIDQPEPGALFSAIAFTPDSSSLYYVVGGTDGDVNVLYRTTLTGSAEPPEPVAEGRFVGPLIVAPNGREAVISERATGGDRDEPYLNLIAVDLRNGDRETVFTGAEVVDGALTNRRFAWPLSWRP